MRPSSDWVRWLPLEPYRFQMGLHPGDPRAFFGPWRTDHELRAERRRWLAILPQDHARLDPSGHPLLGEAARFAAACGTPGVPEIPESGSAFSRIEAYPLCLELGRVWAPDFLLLADDDSGTLRLRGGVVCFPSAWSLPEKMGRTVDEIHGVVPGLNAALGPSISRFLARILPGRAWERANWGLSRGGDLNRHPDRHLPCLEADTAWEEVYARVERQSFYRLPQTRGILFGIRLEIHPLGALSEIPEAIAGLAWALETMPDEVARYKGLAAVRPSLLRRLKSHAERLGEPLRPPAPGGSAEATRPPDRA